MTMLEGENAINYLQRARSCIDPETDQFSNLPCLAAMLDLEIHYLKGLLNNGQENLAVVAIDASGFPELDSWRADLRVVIQEYEQVKVKRAKVLLPFLDQLKNASIAGIAKTGSTLTKQFSDDLEFVACLGSLSIRQLDYLKSSRNQPIAIRKGEMGHLLAATENESPFQAYYSSVGKMGIWGEKYRYIEVNHTAGLKFIDSETEDRPPFILYLPNISEATKPRVLVPGVPLYTRCAMLIRPENVYDLTGIDSYRLEIKMPWLGFYTDVEDWKSYTPIEILLAQIDVHVLNILLTYDICALGENERAILLAAIPRFDDFIKNVSKFTNLGLGCKPITTNDSEAQVASIQTNLQEIMDSLPTDELRQAFQLGLGEAVNPLEQQSRELVKPRQLSSGSEARASIAEGNKKGWLYWLPRLPRLKLGAGSRTKREESGGIIGPLPTSPEDHRMAAAKRMCENW